LPDSGRSTLSIIDLANYLVDWTMNSHPIKEVRDALVAPPYIEATPLDDQQPNPSDDPSQVHLIMRDYTPAEEIKAVVGSLARWLPDHQDDTVAVLVPRNDRGREVVDALQLQGIHVVDDLLRSTSSTRQSAGVIKDLLRALSDPGSPARLAQAYKTWRRTLSEDDGADRRTGHLAELLRRCSRVEDFLWSRSGADWLEESGLAQEDPDAYTELISFRGLMRRWQAAVILPVDQVVLALAQDVFTEKADLALAHKLALLLRRASDAHPAWRLPELTEELSVIANNERRFLGFSQEDTGFDPDRYKGKVVVATMHKAKGLEWDRVYLMSVSTYDFPSGDDQDQYISEKWFIRDNLNLEAETLAQLEAILSADEYQWYAEREATQKARLDYVRERLRLLYVGITRAKKELVITYNTGRKGDQSPAAAFKALYVYWERKLNS